MNSRGPQFEVRTVMPLTQGAKILILIHVGIWLVLQLILGQWISKVNFEYIFGLVPGSVLERFSFWQPFTYMFLHEIRSPMPLIFNMLMLWWLGSELEGRWGRTFFLVYYYFNAVVSAVLYLLFLLSWHLFLSHNVNPAVSPSGALVAMDVPGWSVAVSGASAGIFSMLYAYARLFGERVVSLFFVFPMKAKYFVGVLALIEALTLLSQPSTAITLLCHLGGLLSGLLFFWLYKYYARIKSSSGEGRRGGRGGGSGQSSRKSGRSLRLVVNNPEDKGKSKRYWN